MDTFLSCDWGTSNFRLRCVRIADLQTLAVVQNDQGISQLARSWLQQHGISRQDYYTGFLNRQIAEIAHQLGKAPDGIPVVLSGMASSSIGLMELPYKKLPFSTAGTDLSVQSLQNNQNPLLIISGACTEDDVMRGEETKIVGAAASLPDAGEEQLLLLPGTHSKHVWLRNGQVTAFQTFMTGEFFALLSGSSILAGSIAEGGKLADPADRESFINAVQRSREVSLLAHSFKVRTNQLLKGLSAEQNYYYLSGLLIGEELRTLKPGMPVHLLGGALHTPLYALACEALGINVVSTLDADEALIKGQQVILSAH
ncbi:2-dehydro-3-deoxygalactonokinase [Chitinophaga sp. YIM B06452]|uniref:2-dehydro-3-deoxygalactonokinase n=1 Tax=Chitinophaga sp. YIM B06452 TaxID=3082158 RepID=UPI0031FEBD39